MKYVHRFQVSAPLAAVAEFHRQAASMGAITPPPIVVEVHRAPAQLGEGDEMEFTLWMGPLPIRWLAVIEHTSPTSFMDRQLRGPFDRWVHRHTFVPLADGRTEVLDEVEARPASHWFWRLLGMGMWVNLPILFAYRAWKTKQLLEAAHRPAPVSPAKG
jgi:ligand-binding SRPBCC domain-containing protein